MPSQPTQADIAIHKRAIVRLRKQVFKTHSRDDCGVVSETIRAPSVWETTQFTNAGSYNVREVALGGFDFELSPNKYGRPMTLHVSHTRGKKFDAWISDFDHKGQTYTAYSGTLDFAQLPERLWCVVQKVSES
jgi:hypothetical protein